MFDSGRPPGDDVGVALDQRGSILPGYSIHQGRIAIEVVKVLQQPKAVDLGELGVGLVQGNTRCHFDGDLLKSDRRF